MTVTSELRVFEADHERVVSVTVREIQAVLRAVADVADLDGRELLDATVHERVCHIDTPIIDWDTGEMDYVCSGCGEPEDPSDWARYAFCPNCGARVVSE